MGNTPYEHTDSLGSEHGDKHEEYIRFSWVGQSVTGSTSGCVLHWASSQKGKTTALDPCATTVVTKTNRTTFSMKGNILFYLKTTNIQDINNEFAISYKLWPSNVLFH